MLCLVCAAVLVSCSRDAVASISVKGPSEILVGDFDYSDFTVEVVSDSGSKTEMPLEKSMLSNEDNLKFFTQGTHTLTATYSGKTCEFSLTVCLHEFVDLHFADAVVGEDGTSVINTVYTGKTFTATVFENYPEGTSVYYKNGNTFVNAGSYEVTAIVSRKDYVTKTLTATVNIAKAKYDMSGVSFEGGSAVYDGKEHSIAISGSLPDGVSVNYVDESGVTGANKKTNAGEYSVIARFFGDNVNYEPIADMQATLTIQKKKYDTSKPVFSDDEVVYDGKEHALSVSGCPDGVSVTYKVEKATSFIDQTYEPVASSKVCNAGTYKFTANFKSNDTNYETIAPMEATLKIESADYDASGLVLVSEEVNYDGKGHTIALPTLPKGWTEYSHYFKNAQGEDIYIDNDKNNDYVSEVSDCGTYTYIVTLQYENDNYNWFDLSATLTINKIAYDDSQLKVTCKENADGTMYADVSGVVNPLDKKELTVNVKYFKSMQDKENGNYITAADNKPATSVSDEGEYVIVIEFEHDTVNYEKLLPIVQRFIATKDTSSAASSTRSE